MSWKVDELLQNHFHDPHLPASKAVCFVTDLQEDHTPPSLLLGCQCTNHNDNGCIQKGIAFWDKHPRSQLASLKKGVFPCLRWSTRMGPPIEFEAFFLSTWMVTWHLILGGRKCFVGPGQIWRRTSFAADLQENQRMAPIRKQKMTLAFLDYKIDIDRPSFYNYILFIALSLLNTPLQVKLWDASYTHIPSKPWTNCGTPVFFPWNGCLFQWNGCFLPGSGYPKKPLNYAPNFGSAYILQVEN